MLDNQSPPLENYNLFRTDRVLREAVAREAPDGLNDELTVLGELGGRAGTVALGFDANEHPPQLRTHDGSATASTKFAFIRHGMP
jgi:putative acyl-CoA dehydrogenase